MNRYRYRLSFRKDGDIRWIGHRDLIRVFERALRRANLRLSMTQGFHPKPRFSFPLALALGLEGHAEWMELELQENSDANQLLQRLQPQLPDGLALIEVRRLDRSIPKPVATHVVYQVALPRNQGTAVPQAIASLLSHPTHFVAARPNKPPVDVRAGLVDVRIEHDQLYIEQDVSKVAGAGPRQVLSALGLPDLEHQGYVIARRAVRLHENSVAKNVIAADS